MSSISSLKDFIILIVNNCPLVSSSRLDKTIKAIINFYNSKVKEIETEDLIIYLNKIRVIYYFKRLEYKDKNKAKEFKGKSLLL